MRVERASERDSSEAENKQGGRGHGDMDDKRGSGIRGERRALYLRLPRGAAVIGSVSAVANRPRSNDIAKAEPGAEARPEPLRFFYFQRRERERDDGDNDLDCASSFLSSLVCLSGALLKHFKHTKPNQPPPKLINIIWLENGG